MSILEKLRGLVGDGKRHEAVVMATMAELDAVEAGYLENHCPDELLNLDTINRGSHGDGNGDTQGGGFGGANLFWHGNGFSGFYPVGSHESELNSCGASGFRDGNGRSTTIKEDDKTPRALRLTRRCIGGRAMLVKGGMYIIKMINDLDMVAVIADTEGDSVELGKAVILTEWGTKKGLADLRNTAKLGTYDDAEGWFINAKFICAWVRLEGEICREWEQRMKMVCDEGFREWTPPSENVS